jgi:hypothetical protein
VLIGVDLLSGRSGYDGDLDAGWFDALVERVVLDALVPDQIEVALAAAGQLEQESRQLERQWALRVERARYAAEPLPWQKSRSGTRFHAST